MKFNFVLSYMLTWSFRFIHNRNEGFNSLLASISNADLTSGVNIKQTLFVIPTQVKCQLA